MGSQERHADYCTHSRHTLTAGRLAEECLWEAQEENLSAAEVTDAVGGNLLTFMVSELNRAAEQKADEEGE
jgi:hypothetical protein